MRPFRIRVLTAVFALALLIFGAIPVSANPGDGGIPAMIEASPGDGGVEASPGDGGVEASPGDGGVSD